MRAQTSAEMAGHAGGGCGATRPRPGDGPPTSPACPGSGPDRSAGQLAPGQAQSAEEFLCRFGDAIDDRVAEILDERDALRPRQRPRASLAVVALLPAMCATILLRHEAAAVCAVWLSAAVACLAVLTTRPGRP
jgi:hypothetical protein